MLVIKLSAVELASVIGQLKYAQDNYGEVRVSVDPTDQAFKVKIDGGIWSPPLGRRDQ
jgi:hypothetical protein